MDSPIQYLKEWQSGRVFLLILLDGPENRVTVKTSGFIKDLLRDEIILELADAGELRLALSDDVTFTYVGAEDAAADIKEHIAGAVKMEWPGFRLSLMVRRKQPIITYRDDAT